MIRGDIRYPGPPMAPAETASDRNEAGLSAMVNVGLWGGAAAACLLAVALATRTETGQSRLSAAYGTRTAEVASGPPSPRDADVDARRMVETIRNLTEDRDRLLARMTALERNYEDVTGSIGRLASSPKPPAEPVPPVQPLLKRRPRRLIPRRLGASPHRCRLPLQLQLPGPGPRSGCELRRAAGPRRHTTAGHGRSSSGNARTG